ncbi:TetR family transcriptional regulator [Paractinoplanes ferrugineus]|uniref:TetR family transcriptional regulator n=1 Tax=Paractinoplanes ferrugineus TaxID=113564 RepID=A0A919MFR6_9ACTN|nr:TetR family transcriptional regulator [Actinoplanes ferrugineus]GIE10860.1 TetR family transcriptional regulator [Actinoplanes ferrugineus]
MTSSLPAGLRERKKAKTRLAIREHALRLFEEQGYASTTVEQIAEAAEVSQSTFFRYFPTKEDVILIDDYDPVIVAAIKSQPPQVSHVQALVNGMRSVFDNLTEQEWDAERRRQRIYQSVPELRARALNQMVLAVDMLADALAVRDDRSGEELEYRVIAGALVGVVLAIAPPGGDEYDPRDFGRIEQALGILEEKLSRR